MKSTQRPRPCSPGRCAVLHDQRPRLRAGRGRARTRRSKRLLVGPDVTKIIGSSEDTALIAGAGHGLGELGPLDVEVGGDGRDHPARQRQRADARDALDVDDRDAHQLAQPREGTATPAPVETIARGRSRADAEGQERVAPQVGDVAVGRAVGVHHALVGQQGAGVGLVEGHPDARERGERRTQPDELQEVAAGRADEQQRDRSAWSVGTLGLDGAPEGPRLVLPSGESETWPFGGCEGKSIRSWTLAALI